MPGPATDARRRLLGAAALALLGGCAAPALPPGDGERAWAGRFSLVLRSRNRSQAWSGRFALLASAQHSSIELYSPLGSTLARCEWGPWGARIRVAGGDGPREESGEDPQELALRLLGWPLPLAQLSSWIQGRPAPDSGAQGSKGGEGDETSFDQDGWSVHAHSVAPGGRPVRIEIARAPAPAAADATADSGADSGADSAANAAVALRIVLDPP